MNNIKEVIARKGLLKKWIAEQMGVHPARISEFISETRKPNKERIRKLCKLLGCKVKDLFPNGVKK